MTRAEVMETRRRELADILARSAARLLNNIGASGEVTTKAKLVRECIEDLRGALADYLRTK